MGRSGRGGWHVADRLVRDSKDNLIVDSMEWLTNLLPLTHGDVVGSGSRVGADAQIFGAQKQDLHGPSAKSIGNS